MIVLDTVSLLVVVRASIRPSALTCLSFALGCRPRRRYMYCCVSPAFKYAISPNAGRALVVPSSAVVVAPSRRGGPRP